MKNGYCLLILLISSFVSISMQNHAAQCSPILKKQISSLISEPYDIYGQIDSAKTRAFADNQIIKKSTKNRIKWKEDFDEAVKVWNEYIQCLNSFLPVRFKNSQFMGKLQEANIFLINTLQKLNSEPNNPLFEQNTDKYKATAKSFLQTTIKSIDSYLSTLYPIYNQTLIDLMLTIQPDKKTLSNLLKSDPSAIFPNYQSFFYNLEQALKLAKGKLTTKETDLFLRMQNIKTEKDALALFDKLYNLGKKLEQRNKDLEAEIKKSWIGNQARKDEIEKNKKLIENAKTLMMKIPDVYPLMLPSVLLQKIHLSTKDHVGPMIIFSEAISIANALQALKKQLEAEIKKM